MEDLFTKKVEPTYIEVTYNSSLKDLDSHLEYNAGQPCSNEEEVNTYIEKTLVLKETISKELSTRKLPYEVDLVLLTFMPILNNIFCGLDIRKNMSMQELATMFVSGYDKRYQEALKFCNETIEMYEKDGKNHSFARRYKIYEQHNESVKRYQLGLRTFKDEDFETGLHSFLFKANQLLEMLKDVNKEKES